MSGGVRLDQRKLRNLRKALERREPHKCITARLGIAGSTIAHYVSLWGLQRRRDRDGDIIRPLYSKGYRLKQEEIRAYQIAGMTRRLVYRAWARAA